MSKRTAALVIVLLSYFMVGICEKTVMTTWPVNTRNTFFSLVSCVALFYIGLDLVIASETSLLYRLVKNSPFSWWKPLTAVRITAVFFICGGVFFGWIFLDRLLELIK
jgi:hypothetical protein